MLPYLTAELPGTGGALRSREEDFEVDEVAAYPASGEGEHVFVHIEKRGVTTLEAARALARAAGVPERDVGTAGLKDKRAIARQWLSLPPPADPDALVRIDPERLLGGRVRILAAARHRHKLRTGHLVGNRFRLTVRGLRVAAPEAERRARAVLARLTTPPGAPNWYGEQRFGKDGDNARIGRAILAGDVDGRAPRGRERRLYVSALQSELFNEVLRRRLADRLLDRVVHGDVLQRCDSGGPFCSVEPEVDRARLLAGEVVLTGPMYGHDSREPLAGSEAAAREAAVLAEAGLSREAFRPLGKLAPGTRRPLTVRPLDAEAEAVAPGDDALELRFTLPAGAYATAIAREILKPDGEP